MRSGVLPAAFEAHLGNDRKLVPAVLIHASESSHVLRVFGSGMVAESDAVHTLLKSCAKARRGCLLNSKQGMCARELERPFPPRGCGIRLRVAG